MNWSELVWRGQLDAGSSGHDGFDDRRQDRVWRRCRRRRWGGSRWRGDTFLDWIVGHLESDLSRSNWNLHLARSNSVDVERS